MKLTAVLLIAIGILLASCATFREPVPTGSGADRDRVVEEARSFVGIRDLRRVDPHFARNDCAGYVMGVYKRLGYTFDLTYYRGVHGVAETLYRNLRDRGLTRFNGRPRKGDAVFFTGTVPGGANRITHMGLVADVEDDGTVMILHYESKGVTEIKMNLRRPRDHRDENGDVINHFIRRKPKGNMNVPLLSGELFYSYGDLFSFAESSS
jgi:hypothetical protein